MKIVVAATRHAHALSRREVEALFAALPPEYASGIDEFLLSSFARGAEPFEYSAVTRRAEFFMPVVDRTAASTERALREFLLGVARVQAQSTFRRPLDRSERREYEPFIAEWLPACRAAVGLAVV